MTVVGEEGDAVVIKEVLSGFLVFVGDQRGIKELLQLVSASH